MGTAEASWHPADLDKCCGDRTDQGLVDQGWTDRVPTAGVTLSASVEAYGTGFMSRSSSHKPAIHE